MYFKKNKTKYTKIYVIIWNLIKVSPLNSSLLFVLLRNKPVEPQESKFVLICVMEVFEMAF